MLGAMQSRLVCGLVLVMLCGCATGQGGAGREDPTSVRAATGDVPLMISRYEEDRRAITKFHYIEWSESRHARLDALAAGMLEELSKLDFSKLDQQSRIDVIAMRNHLRNERNYQALEKRRMEEMEPLLSFRRAIVELEERRWKMEKIDAESAAGQIETIAQQAREARAKLEKKENWPSATVALRAASATSQLEYALRTFVEYSDGFVPEFSWWVKKPWENAAGALGEYARALREKVAGQHGAAEDPLVGDPIGRATLLEDLKNEMVAYTPEELIAIADKEFAWCEAEMKKAAAEMGCGEDWKKALDKVKQDHMPPGGQAELVTRQSREAIEFVKKNDLVTVPALAEELWRLQMLSPGAQRSLPFAAYGDQCMLVAYPTDDMSHADKEMSMRGNNVQFSHIVVPHELIPGHHLQRFYAERNRAYRGIFSTPFYVEGWALYWEMKLWDLKWSTTPQDRVGMLFWRMHRCARILVSLKFHLGEMTPDQMIAFLVERVGHERLGATSEVRRFIGGAYSPLYQCGYMVGGKALRRLHEELVKSGKMSERDFNDAVLKQNTLPMELVRASLSGTELKWTTEGSWKFAD